MRTLDEVDLSPQDRVAVKAAADLLRRTFPVEQVVLFGSKSRGDDDVESDIDLLVLTTRPLSHPEQHAISDALFPLQLEHDVVLSPLIVAAEEWRSGIISVMPIRDEVEEQGAIA
jgi:predicted nucleotidyltransferase